jgi:hypothetical protein
MCFETLSCNPGHINSVMQHHEKADVNHRRSGLPVLPHGIFGPPAGVSRTDGGAWSVWSSGQARRSRKPFFVRANGRSSAPGESRLLFTMRAAQPAGSDRRAGCFVCPMRSALPLRCGAVNAGFVDGLGALGAIKGATGAGDVSAYIAADPHAGVRVCGSGAVGPDLYGFLAFAL